MTSGRASHPDGYDGFISYSHAADDLLAPRLQAGLQRFAKPWWKRRAVRIFRDEASLSANPHLWSSITEALDSSEWFVLLLSPDAADSEWVDREVAYWLEHKDPSRIIPVLTSGEFGWSEEGLVSDAAPPSLTHAFSEEPRWVDLRFARSDEQLDLKNPRFSAAVADIASTVRGIPKDELESEEVRQHRRTVRTAWAAGVLVLGLGVASVVFGVQSANNAREARDNEAVALAQSANSEARRLVALANGVLEVDAQLALLLLLQAYPVAADDEVRAEVVVALQKAAVENRLIARFDAPSGPLADFQRGAEDNPISRVGSFANRGALSPDGSTVYHASRDTNRLVAYRVADGDVLWEHIPTGPIKTLDSVSVSPDGTEVALSVVAPLGESGRIEIIDSQTGDVIKPLPSSGCPVVIQHGGGFSADGRFFTFLSGNQGCVDPSSPAEADWVEVYRTSTWEPAFPPILEPGATLERLQITGRRALLSAVNERGREVAVLLTFPGLEPVKTIETKAPILSPSGRSIASMREQGTRSFENPQLFAQAVLWRAESDYSAPTNLGPLFDMTEGHEPVEGFSTGVTHTPLSFSPDGSLLAVAARGTDRIVDVRSGLVTLTLYGETDTFDASWSEDGTRLLTTHHNELLLWELTSDPSRWAETIATGDWVGFARKSLVRGFTTAECLNFLIDPCPTLEQMTTD